MQSKLIANKTSPQSQHLTPHRIHGGSEVILSTKALYKRHPGFTLGPMDLEICSGSVVALIGLNGAGKTTLFDCIAGLRQPDGGIVRRFGQDGRLDTHMKAQLGYATDGMPLFERWSGARNLAFMAKYFSNWSEPFLRTLVHRLEVPLDKPINTLSKGNRTKLGIVAALAHRPKLLLLDEPTSGLDPLARDTLLEILDEYVKDREKTILYSSHILPELFELSDDIIFLHEGKLTLHETTQNLRQHYRAVTFRMTEPLPAEIAQCLVTSSHSENEYHAVTTNAPELKKRLTKLGVNNLDCRAIDLNTLTLWVLRPANNEKRTADNVDAHLR